MRIALCLILSFISQVICPQTTFLQKVKEGLKERILELDPIEGVYEFETSGYASIDGVSQSNKDQGIWVICNIKGTKDYIVTNENGYGDGRKIRRIGDTNWYMLILNNGNKEKFQFDGASFTLETDEYLPNGLYSKFVMRCIKSYPTEQMHIEAIRREAEKKAESEVPQNWTGTGFALNNRYLVTNYHVVENAKSIVLTGINGNFGTKYTAMVVGTDKKNDLALLKLNENVSITNIPYTVNTTTSEVGEDVFVLGYPLTATMGDEIKLTTGVISSKSGFQGDISQYQISAPIQPGNSGGPLFDSKGNIIGIVSAKHAGAENVGYAIKTSYLKSLVESVTSTNVLPQANIIATQNLSGKVKAVKNYVYYITCTR